MVRRARLIVDDRDRASVDAAEGVLVHRVGEATRNERLDVLDRTVVLFDLIERTVVARVKRANRAVRGDARAAVVCINVAWPERGRGGGGRGRLGPSTSNV